MRRVTPGMRSSRRLSSTWRRPAPTKRPATAIPTEATEIAPATIRKTRRSCDSEVGAALLGGAAASMSAECTATQVSSPTSDGQRVDRAGVALRHHRAEPDPGQHAATRAPVATTTARASDPAQAKQARSSTRMPDDEHRLVGRAEDRDRPLGDRARA